MRIFLCQTSSTSSKVPVIPYSQLALAAQIEDIAEVQVAGNSEDGTYPTASVILEKIKEFNPDAVGITIEYAVAFSASLELAKQIKEFNPKITVVSGGHHATFTAPLLLASGFIDAIFTGEGETTIHEFALTNDIKRVPNAIYLENGEIIRTPSAPLVDVNELRAPAYHLLSKSKRPLLGIESSRGCPFNCDFCETRNFFGSGKLRKMSPEHFIKNLKQVIEVTGGGNFIMLDDNFTADMKGHVKPICEALIKEDLPASFFFQARVDDMLRDIDLLPLLAKAKFKSVLLGIEAIYDETLDLMNKKAKYNKETIRKLVKACKDNGIAVFGAIVFGYPNETPDMILNTSEYLISLDVDTISMTIATPIPGSALYKNAIENKQLLSTNFDYYGGMHRVLSTIPDTTPLAAANARRNFFIRPQYIRRILNNAIDPAKSDISGFMPAGLLCHNLSMPEQSMPRNTEEWVKVLEGLSLFLSDNLVDRNLDYSADIGFIFGSEALMITVKKGIPVAVNTLQNDCDVVIESSVETMVDFLIWSPLDIISAFILGEVKSNSDFDKLSDFIIWFNESQQLLRWAITIRRDVPKLRYRLQSWLNNDSKRLEKFEELISKELTLYIGTEELGLVMKFSSSKGLDDLYLAKDYSEKTNYKWLIEKKELNRIIDDGFDVLINILDTLEFKENISHVIEFKTPREFFKTLPSKFKSEKSMNVNMVIQYLVRMEDESVESWYMEIKNGVLHITVGTSVGTPTAIIKIPITNFLKMINGRTTPPELFTTGGMELIGLPQTMIQMAACFENMFKVT